MILEDCEGKCRCDAGVFSCESYECEENRVCAKKNGAVGCYRTGNVTTGHLMVHSMKDIFTFRQFTLIDTWTIEYCVFAYTLKLSLHFLTIGLLLAMASKSSAQVSQNQRFTFGIT